MLLEQLGSLYLLLDLVVLPVGGIHQLLLEVELSGLLVKGLLLLQDLDGGEHLGCVGLGLEGGILSHLVFLHLGLVDLVEGDFVLGLHGLLLDLAILRGLVELLGLLLCLLDDDTDELRPLLHSDLHLDIEGISDLCLLLIDKVGSSLSGSGQSLVRDLTDLLGLLEGSELLCLGELLLDGLEGDRRSCFRLHKSLDDWSF